MAFRIRATQGPVELAGVVPGVTFGGAIGPDGFSGGGIKRGENAVTDAASVEAEGTGYHFFGGDRYKQCLLMRQCDQRFTKVFPVRVFISTAVAASPLAKCRTTV